MIQVNGYAAHNATSALIPYHFERNDPKKDDVVVDILFCGICHADIHQAKNEFGATSYPLVPGHEIVGRVKSIGESVTRFRTGDLVGVGYFINSCRTCKSCHDGDENYCEIGITATQNGKLADGTTTKGGYSDSIVVDENYLLKIPENLDLAGVAPLLCAGITTYSPIKYWGIGKGDKVAILGLGGVGHMAVKFAVSFGADVTVLSTSAEKQVSARQLGAQHFILTSEKELMKSALSSFDFIIDTVSAKHDYNQYLSLLNKDGMLILLGVPPDSVQFNPYSVVSKRRMVVGSFIGGIKETQEMLDYCAEMNITAEVEVISLDYINMAFERTLKGDVRYRFVIDMKKMKLSN